MKMKWEDAAAYAEKLGGEWRLPRIEELRTLFNNDEGKAIFPTLTSFYWSSVPHEASSDRVWVIDLSPHSGFIGGHNTKYTNGVLCVHGKRWESSGVCTDKLENGQERVTVNPDGTITDNLTGLVWRGVEPFERRFSVYITMPVAFRVDGISAPSMADAAQKAEEFVWDHRDLFNRLLIPETTDYFSGSPRLRHFELSEGEIPVCALVDNEGDPEFLDSLHFIPGEKETWVKDPNGGAA